MNTNAPNLKAIGANIKKASAEMIVLNLIASKKETYGFEIARTMSELTYREYHIGEGSTYTILTRLVENGCITSERRTVTGKRVRVYYKITKKGLDYLKKMKDEYLHQTNLVLTLLNEPNLPL